jgi:glycosyltransferase involved in cell wall biosynthesis
MPETSPPLHLIWVTPNDLRTTMDAATFLDTAEEMRKLDWKVSLVSGAPPEIKNVRGIEITPIPSPEIYFLGQHIFHQRALRFIKHQRPPADVVLFQDVSGLWLLGLCPWRHLRRRSRPLIVFDTRSVYMPDKSARRDLKGIVREAYLKAITLLANRWADGQTAITERLAKSIQIPEEKIWGFWPSGVTPERFSSAAEDRHWPAPDEDIQLIYVGSTHYERNLLTLAKAVVEARKTDLLFHLTIIGGGAQQEELKIFAHAHPHALTVYDPIPHNDIPMELAKAHIGVLPFPDEEKFRVSSPIKLFEYMASGLPVMATRIACHTDVMADADYAFYANGANVPALVDCLKSISQHRESLPALGRHATQDVHNWSWAAAARKLDKALKKGLGAN